MKIGYYPGCALHGSSNDYEQSLRACLGHLDIDLAEIQDWICCGATAAHSLNHKLSLALPARNLALAEQQSLDELLAPCPLCSMQLLKVSAEIKEPDARAELSNIVELPLEGRTRVINLIQVFQKVGLDTLAAAVTTKQEAVQAACYYGCLLTRPPKIVTFDDPEQPQSMEAVLTALGAKPVDWNFKTECCGAGMTMADEDDRAGALPTHPGQRRSARRQLHGGGLPHVPREPRHEAGRQSNGVTAAATACRSITSPTWSGWRWVWRPTQLGIDRHFVRGGVSDGANRRVHLLVRREHRPHRRRGQGRRSLRRDSRACAARWTTSTCAPIPGQSLMREKIASETTGRRGGGLLLAAHAPEDLPPGGRARRGSIPIWSRWPTSASIAPGCITTASEATAKAIELIRMSVAKVRHNHALDPIRVPVTRRALVIGGGVAGHSGGARYRRRAATKWCWWSASRRSAARWPASPKPSPRSIARSASSRPRMVEVGQHPRIKLYTYSEVEAVDGFVGNFKVTIRKKARYVDIAKCTGCGECWNVCPLKKNPSEFDYGMGIRPAIYVPFPQAVPARPVIDKNVCAKLIRNGCGLCEKKCPAGAINFKDEDRLVEEKVGAIVVATGYKLYNIGKEQPSAKLHGYGEYGYGKYKDVIDSLQFERLVSASGPTNGEVRAAVRRQGAARRSCSSPASARATTPRACPYCSKICCMYTAKHTMLYKHKVHDGRGARLLHGHPRGRQGLRRVRAPRHRAGRRAVLSRPGLENHRGERQADRARRRYAGRQRR